MRKTKDEEDKVRGRMKREDRGSMKISAEVTREHINKMNTASETSRQPIFHSLVAL